MTKQREKDHVIHQYYQTSFKTSGTIIYKCGLPGCTHFIYEPLVLNRLSLCYRCGESFLVTAKSMRAKKMHCEECSRGQFNKAKKKEITAIERESDAIVDQILGDINSVIDDAAIDNALDESEVGSTETEKE